jgi:hypothetical protein
MDRNKAICRGGAGVIAILLASAIVVVASRGAIGSTAAKAAFIARVAETAVSHAASSLTTAPDSTTVPGAPGAGAAPAQVTPAKAVITAGGTGGANVPRPTGPSAATSASAATPAATGAHGGTTPAAISTLAPRRQPTSAEVKAAIKAFENAVPFYSPTVADIADVGNKVCTAFDQGQTFAQVKARALTMVGAGALSFLIPSSVPAQAVRTLVTLYCPGYAGRLG